VSTLAGRPCPPWLSCLTRFSCTSGILNFFWPGLQTMRLANCAWLRMRLLESRKRLLRVIAPRESDLKSERPEFVGMKKVHAHANLDRSGGASVRGLRRGDPKCFTVRFEKEAGSNWISPERNEPPWVLIGNPKASIDRLLNSESFSMAFLNLKWCTQVSDPLPVGLYSASIELRPDNRMASRISAPENLELSASKNRH